MLFGPSLFCFCFDSFFKTDSNVGLSSKESKQKLQSEGPNSIPEIPPKTWFLIFLTQFQSPLIYVLLVAAIIIFIVGEHKSDAFIITGIILFNALIGTIQEGRTNILFESLKRFLKNTTVVVRDGEQKIVSVSDLVEGDIIILQEGERVPADARIIESHNLQIDESMLTGESESQHKNSDPLTGDLSIINQTNMVFKGTYIVSGSGKAIVTTTGIKTQLGLIYKNIQSDNQQDIPLNKEMKHLSYYILIFIFIMCIFLFIIGIITNKPARELIVILASLFACVIPEGLPVVLTLVLASGAYRMAQKEVLIKRLQAIETLGHIDTIIIDKTGTLTQNELMVSTIFADNKMWLITGRGYRIEGEIFQDNVPAKTVEPESHLAQIGIASLLLNNATLSFDPELDLFNIKGDPLEAALSVYAQKIGLSPEKYKQM